MASNQYKPHLVPTDFLDAVHQLAEVGFELLQLRWLFLALGFCQLKRRRHAVAQERHGRFHERDLFLHALEPFLL